MRNTVYYSDSGIEKITKLLTTVLACLLPIAAVVILYFVESMPQRLGIIGGLAAVFSMTLSLMTGARVADIFAATAA